MGFIPLIGTITTILLKLNEVILIRNYLQQKKKHQAS
jgi:hypothetical protein